jgi:hypothetical protein
MHRGSDQLVKAGKRKIRFGLDTASAQNVHVGCGFTRVVEQRGLAHSGRAADDERVTS